MVEGGRVGCSRVWSAAASAAQPTANRRGAHKVLQHFWGLSSTLEFGRDGWNAGQFVNRMISNSMKSLMEMPASFSSCFSLTIVAWSG